MSKKNLKALTLDLAITRLEAFREEAGNGNIPFLAETGQPKELQLCDVVTVQAGASDILRVVSRGGIPVVKIALYVPSKDDTESALPYLTLSEALSRLTTLRADLPGEAPVLVDACGAWTLQLCDLKLKRHGVGAVYKQVIRGGLPVAVVTFGPPVQA